MTTTRRKIKSEMKRSRLEKDGRKTRHNGPQEGGGEGFCLHGQEVQDSWTHHGCTVYGGQEDLTFDK